MLTPIGLTEMKPGFNLLIEIEIQKRKRMDGLGKPGFNYLIKIEIWKRKRMDGLGDEQAWTESKQQSWILRWDGNTLVSDKSNFDGGEIPRRK